MSEGPIKRAREAWKPPVVSTTAKDRVCAVGSGMVAAEPEFKPLPRSYCGRTSAPRVEDWDAVSCADCQAARRADEAVV